MSGPRVNAGANAEHLLRLVHGHNSKAAHVYEDKLAPAARAALAAKRSAGDVPAPLVALEVPPTEDEHEATLAAMLGDLDELSMAMGAAARGEDLDLRAVASISAIAVARWERLRSCLGDAHALTRRARSVQIRSTVLATDWIPSLVIEHRQAARGLPS